MDYNDPIKKETPCSVLSQSAGLERDGLQGVPPVPQDNMRKTETCSLARGHQIPSSNVG